MSREAWQHLLWIEGRVWQPSALGGATGRNGESSPREALSKQLSPGHPEASLGLDSARHDAARGRSPRLAREAFRKKQAPKLGLGRGLSLK